MEGSERNMQEKYNTMKVRRTLAKGRAVHFSEIFLLLFLLRKMLNLDHQDSRKKAHLQGFLAVVIRSHTSKGWWMIRDLQNVVLSPVHRWKERTPEIDRKATKLNSSSKGNKN